MSTNRGATQEGLSLQQRVANGYRVPLPFDDDLLVVEALAAGSLSLKVACLVRVALARLPTEVVVQILAFALHRTLVMSPYCGPRAATLNEHRRYVDPRELWSVRKTQTLQGIPDHNTCFTGVCPYPIAEGEIFFAEGQGAHKFGIGFVTEEHDQASRDLRFNPAAMVVYQGIEILSVLGEHELVYQHSFVNSVSYGPLGLGLHRCKATGRRYASLWGSRNTCITFWLPDEVFLKPSAKRTSAIVQVFPAFQIWANGRGGFSGTKRFALAELAQTAIPVPDETHRLTVRR